MAKDEMVGVEFRQARIRSGLGYRAFAAALGVGKSSVARYELGQQPIPRKVALAVIGLEAELISSRPSV